MELTSEIIKRLAFIKYFYQFAREQSKLPSPQNYISILMFHDSVELFNYLTAQLRDITIKTKTNFMEYWQIFKQDGFELTRKADMNKLNEARKGFKHSGNLPNKDDIEFFRVNTQSFFEENCPVIFGIKFTEISLLNLIQDEEVKETLEKAQIDFNNEHYKESLENIAIAFRILLENYEENKKVYGKSPFDIGDDQRIQEVLKIIILNLDYRKYVKFRSLTPDRLVYAINVRFSPMWFSKKDKTDFKKEDVEYCIEFVIESALKLQEFDFEIDKDSSSYIFFT